MAQRNPKVKLPKPPAQQLYGVPVYKRAGDGAAVNPNQQDQVDAHYGTLRAKKYAERERTSIRRGQKGRYLPDHARDRGNKDRAFGGSGYNA